MDRSSEHRRLVVAQLRPGRGAALALLAAIGAMTALPLLAPQLTRRIIDGAIADEPTGSLITLAVVYLAVALGGQVARVATAWVASVLAWDGTNRLRERLAEHALALDLAYQGGHTPGEMIERVDGDVVALADFMVTFLLDVVASLLLLAGVLVLVTLADVRIGVALVVYVVLLAALVAPLQRRAVPSATAARSSVAALFGYLEERLTAVEDIRANGAGEHVVRRFHDVSADAYRADLRAERASGGVFVITNVALAIATALVLGGALLLHRSGSLTVGTAVLLFQYTQMVRQPFENIVDQLDQYQKALAGVERIGQLLAEQPTLVAPAAGGQELPGGALEVTLQGVAFAYGSRGETDSQDAPLVIRDVDLRVGPGRSLGLVGRTGSGKTTIARLVLRLYDPTAGSVRLGGVDLRTADPVSLRHRVAMVTQDVQLFATTVRDNLTLFGSAGSGSVDDARLRSILDEVGLGTWFAGLPDGLDTVLGPGGAGLSAGEAQLLALARAFRTDPGLVVLDEASSRLDRATETIIEGAIDRLLEGRTAVVIAHRLSSLSRVDDIAVIDGGRVVEYGPRFALAADPASRYAGLLAAAGLGLAGATPTGTGAGSAGASTGGRP